MDGRGNLGPKPLSCQKVPLGGCRVISSFDWGYGVVRRGVAVLKLGFEEHGLQDGPCGDEIRKLVRQIDVGRTIHLRGSYQRLLVVRWDVPVARVFAWGGGAPRITTKHVGGAKREVTLPHLSGAFRRDEGRRVLPWWHLLRDLAKWLLAPGGYIATGKKFRCGRVTRRDATTARFGGIEAPNGPGVDGTVETRARPREDHRLWGAVTGPHLRACLCSRAVIGGWRVSQRSQT